MTLTAMFPVSSVISVHLKCVFGMTRDFHHDVAFFFLFFFQMCYDYAGLDFKESLTPPDMRIPSGILPSHYAKSHYVFSICYSHILHQYATAIGHIHILHPYATSIHYIPMLQLHRLSLSYVECLYCYTCVR